MELLTRAIMATGPRRVEMVEFTLPAPSSTQVLVEAEVCGVSIGTEGWFLLCARPEGQFPMVMGYQAVGIVRDVGAEVTCVRPGQRVYFSRTVLPEPYRSNGWMSTHLSRAIVEATHCVPVPEGVGAEEASLAALGSVALVGIEMAQPTVHDTVAVLGLGIIGQMSAQWARSRGSRVLAGDRLAARVALAGQYSADEVVDCSREDFADFVKSRTLRPGQFGTPAGADVVIDATGASIPDVWVEALGFKGRLVLQGWYPHPIPLNQHPFHHRLATVYFPCSQTQEGERATLLGLQRGQLQLRPLISHMLPAVDAQQGYDLMLDHPEKVLGMVFSWEGA